MKKHLRKIIVTRPEEQAQSLITNLQTVVNNRYEIMHLPLIRIAPLEFTPVDQQQFDGIIFISSNAVNAFYARHQASNSHLFAVGNNTAGQVKKLSGYTAIFPKQMHSQGLLALEQLKNINGQHWLIVKGVDGKQDLQQTLAERGAKVTLLDVYSRQMPQKSVQQSIINIAAENPLWLISSGVALHNLQNILQQTSSLQPRVIVSSDSLAAIAREKGFKIVAQSAGAAEEQLVKCVQHLNLLEKFDSE